MDNQNFAFKTITKFDGFGATVNLQIFGDKNDKNLLGAAISIGMLALSIALSFSTFLEFVNGTNPTISSSVEYSTQNLTINYTNFFFGISFFEPYRDVRSLDSSANNLPAIKFINQLNISCTTCEGEYLNSDAIMNLCNPDQFNNISIKSMSAAKSKGVNSIFSAYSFCFPQELKSVIKDNNEENSLQESSLQLFIPVNNVSIEFTAVKQNLAPQPGADTLTSKISSSTSTNVAAQAPVPQPDYAPAPVQNPTAPQQQPQSGPAGGGMQQPTQGQMSPTGSGTQMQGPTGGSTSQQKPGGTTGGMTQQQQPGGTQTQQQQPGGTQTQQQQPGGTQTQQQQPGGTTSPTSSPTPTGVTSPTSSPTPTGTTSPTSGPTPTGTTSPTSGPTGPAPPPAKRRIRTLQAASTNSNSGLEASLSKYIDSSVNSVVNKTVYDMMKTVFYAYKFPKMMIIHRGVEVTTASKNVVNFVYHMDVLDYLDPLTGNPNVFDVYLQKYQVIVDTGSFFSSTPNMVEFIVVNKIEKNSFDSLQNSGAYLSYKLYSDSQQIYVKYVSFTDVLGVFGSFYSIFSLLGGLLSGLYNEMFLDHKLISSVFRFIGNKIENRQLDDFMFAKKNMNFNDNSFFDRYGVDDNGNKNKKNDNPNYTKVTNIIGFLPNKEADKNKRIEMEDLNKNNLYIEVGNNKLNKQKEENKNLSKIDAEKQLVDKDAKIKDISSIDKESIYFKKNKDSDKNSFNKDEETKFKEVDTTIEVEVDFKDLFELHQEKKKKKKKYIIGIWEYLIITKCTCLNRKKFGKRKEILTKCKDIIDHYLQINNIIKKLMEFEMLKRLTLSENQTKLMRYQFKYLNFENPDETLNFLNSIKNSDKVEADIFEKDKIQIDNDLKMLDNFNNYYNF